MICICSLCKLRDQLTSALCNVCWFINDSVCRLACSNAWVKWKVVLARNNPPCSRSLLPFTTRYARASESFITPAQCKLMLRVSVRWTPLTELSSVSVYWDLFRMTPLLCNACLILPVALHLRKLISLHFLLPAHTWVKSPMDFVVYSGCYESASEILGVK